MKSLAAAIQGSIGDTVVDATGLIGLYDVNLDFNVDESEPDEGPTVFEGRAAGWPQAGGAERFGRSCR